MLHETAEGLTGKRRAKADAIVTYSFKAIVVEPHQPAVTWQRPVNNKRIIEFSAQPMSIAVHSAIEYVMPSLSIKCTATEKMCFLCSPSRMYIMTQVSKQTLDPV
jgi:hypothetical protein